MTCATSGPRAPDDDRRRWAMMTAMPRHHVLTSLRGSDMDACGHVDNVLPLQIIDDARADRQDEPFPFRRLHRR